MKWPVAAGLHAVLNEVVIGLKMEWFVNAELPNCLRSKALKNWLARCEAFD